MVHTPVDDFLEEKQFGIYDVVLLTLLKTFFHFFLELQN